jgi:hypothetical protein
MKNEAEYKDEIILMPVKVKVLNDKVVSLDYPTIEQANKIYPLGSEESELSPDTTLLEYIQALHKLSLF